MCTKRKTTNRTRFCFFNSVVRSVIHNITEELLQFVELEYTHGHHCDKDDSPTRFWIYFGSIWIFLKSFKQALPLLYCHCISFYFLSSENLESKNKNCFYIGVSPVFFLSLKVNHITPKIVLEE